jgi:eukaryotic-like serine/threonine-protein kinase
MANSPERASLPHAIGRYEVVGQLATGGMAEILLGRLSGPSGFERTVVIKRILPHLARDQRFADMLTDEARIVGKIAHPNVVSVQELGREHDDLYLVMEYLEGESLGGLMRRLWSHGQSLGPALACHLIAETAAGLHAAHELVDSSGRSQELVHRDVTPQNVFVTYAGDVKLLDFGIAKAENRSTRTETGLVKGKFAYMSPEQCLGKPLDRRSDVFALGILLYELTTGRRLFKQTSELMTFRAICELPLTPPSALVPGYPRGLEAIVLGALARPLGQRTATAAELRRDLLRIVHSLGEHEPKERLASLMRSLFADRMAQKAEMLRRVERGGALKELPPAEVDESVDLPAATELGSAVHTVQRPRPRSRGPGLIALLSLLLLATSTLIARALTPEIGRLELALPAIAAEVAALGAPPRLELVRIRVESIPEGASVLLDDELRGVAPISLELPRSERKHRLELRSAGRSSVVRELVADENQKLLISLETKASPAVRPRAATPSTRPKKPKEGFERFD